MTQDKVVQQAKEIIEAIAQYRKMDEDGNCDLSTAFSALDECDDVITDLLAIVEAQECEPKELTEYIINTKEARRRAIDHVSQLDLDYPCVVSITAYAPPITEEKK